MVTNLHVVGDLDLVVELDPVTDPRVGQRTTVDGSIDADFHVITNGDATDLAILRQIPFSLAKPKPSPPITAPDWMTTRLPMTTS